MRWLKRRWRHFIAEWKLRGRRAEIIAEIQKYFGWAEKPVLKGSGSRGHDSNYIVHHDGKKFGVLRLVNPYKSRALPEKNMPFILPEAQHRLAREHACYQAGAAMGLTPRPLWRGDDALMCAYLPLLPLQDRLKKTPDQSWIMICAAARKIRDLHALKITHMDMSLANTLADESLEKIVFVDFEYDAAAGIMPAAQRVYDHLRLVESVWKFIPEDKRSGYGTWIDIYAASLDPEMKRVNLATLEPALPRVLNALGLGAAIRKAHAS